MLNSKRVVFKEGKQRAFIENILTKSGRSIKELANFLKVSERAISDWHREKFLMPLLTVRKLTRLASIKVPKFEIRGRYDHVRIAGSLGGKAIIAKYGSVGGDSEKRKTAWRNWWNREGKFIKNKILEPKQIKIPTESSDLAEFVGIMMGDGGVSERQISITLHSITDDQYKDFVVKLIRKLFGVMPGVHKRGDSLANTIFVSRTELVKFCTNGLGLPLGHKIKQRLDIPDWINASKDFQIACLRGLIDTDGSVVIHKYRVGGKRYSYKKIEFSSASRPLFESVVEILTKLGLNPNRNKRHLTISASKNVEKYFKIISSHNPKHLKRYKE